MTLPLFPSYREITLTRGKVAIGMGNTAEEAYAMYCKAAEELHGEFARMA